MPKRRFLAPLPSQFVSLSARCLFGPLPFRPVGFLVCCLCGLLPLRHVGLSARWLFGPLAFWSVGFLVCCLCGSLAFWSVGFLVCCLCGPLAFRPVSCSVRRLVTPPLSCCLAEATSCNLFPFLFYYSIRLLSGPFFRPGLFCLSPFLLVRDTIGWKNCKKQKTFLVP